MNAVASPLPAPCPPARTRLASPVRAESPVADLALARLAGLDWTPALAAATRWVQAVRAQPAPFWALESLLREYPISSAEGLALMRLAEALLRVPDADTAMALTADQLGRADFDAQGGGPHRVLASLSASAIALSKRFLPEADSDAGLMRRLGGKTVVAATVRAIGLLGRQFVLGRDMVEALRETQAQREALPELGFSFDMLGEGARCDADALRYLEAYAQAIARIADAGRPSDPERGDGISIKLSALFARFEEAQRERVFAELLPRAWSLVDAAARAGINLTIDAEESERLELSLDVFDALAARVAAEHPGWAGMGLAVQAYQTRALDVVDAVVVIAKQHGLRLMVRLVKGAYWDAEIKRAQELGLAGYPVFTHKAHTDLNYLACARALLAHPEQVYPQFATHNAATIAAVLQMAQGQDFEMQRLHGMGEAVYREVMKGDTAAPRLRVYAPVGEHKDLLAYLVRRLLENGANSSFVNRLSDPAVPVDELLALPQQVDSAEALPLPVAMFGASRRNAAGADLNCLAQRAPFDAALATWTAQTVSVDDAASVSAAMRKLAQGHLAWDARPVSERSELLRRAADRLEQQAPDFCADLVHEAHKTLGDALAEVREAVDFLRYYAQQADTQLAEQTLPGPTGERNVLRLIGRGVFVCISPWNFPLAIFCGQIAAALVGGNSVAAKPAEQTPGVAQRLVALLHEVGVPDDVVALLNGPGETVGAALVAHAQTAGVCFTGSTVVARTINRALAAKDGPIVPLIAETGGINAMLVDSSALPEQVVDAVVQSAFRSAGQRCSALRLLCVHAEIADTVIAMLVGAMAELRVDAAPLFATDVAPVIDAEAFDNLQAEIACLRQDARWLGESPRQGAHPRLIAPVAFEIKRMSDLKAEVFGPVLHVLRWSGDPERVIADINDMGYGLTLGIQTRIDSRALRLAAQARVGNVYVNRNMIGAVVGVQPFGGEGLSGTGPKAGGPHYLPRFCAEQTLTINTAAAGGNASLLSGLG